MKQPPSNTEIVEQIITHLGRPLRRPGAHAAVERTIEMLHKEASWPFPDAASIGKTAASIGETVKLLLRKLEPFGDGQQIPLEGCDRGVMTVGEFRSGRMTFGEFLSALDWFEHINGPSARFDRTKYLAAVHADCLVNGFSQKLPTGTIGGPVREIASLLYEAISGREADLKRQIDAVRRSWRGLEGARDR